MSELLNDRYELGDVVGAGGMGAVYRAVDTRLGRTVAVKVLRGGALADEVARARMRSEARLASSIHHLGIAQVFDYDAASTSHGGMSFIVMELVDGQSLSQLLREHGPMPVDQVMSVVQQVADALAAAHAAGVVHRDLKPANIMLTPAGRTVLVDFGIASSAISEPLTETGALLGTADYLSPEVAAGRPATAQSDLYSLGMVAHHCLTGRPPFRRENPIATALAHLNEDLPPLDPSVPLPVRDLVTRLAEKSPYDRPSSAADVAAEAAIIGAAPSVDIPPTVALAVLDEQATTVQPAPARPRRPHRTRRSMSLFSAAGLAAVVVTYIGVDRMGTDPVASVPDVVGMDATEAVATLKADGMTGQRATVDIAGAPAGSVVRQSPEPGANRPADGEVDVDVASGLVRVSADRIVGLTYTRAAAALERSGFVVARDDTPGTTDVGTVSALDRSGRLPDGSTITLTVIVAAPTESTSPTTSVSAPPTSSRSPRTSAGKTTGTNTGKTKGNGNGNGQGRSKGKGKK